MLQFPQPTLLKISLEKAKCIQNPSDAFAAYEMRMQVFVSLLFDT